MSIDFSIKNRKIIEMVKKLMKLKYKKCLEELKKITGLKISHSEISQIINVSANALSNRLSNDGYLKDEEIEKIEKYFKTNFDKNSDSILLDFFSCFAELKNKKPSKTISIPFNCFDKFSKSKKYFALNALGDTMSPYIKEGDKLIIENFDFGQIQDNRIYIFNFEDEIFIKRLVKNLNQIVVKSDNEIYPIRFIEDENFSKFSIIGELVGLIRNMA